MTVQTDHLAKEAQFARFKIVRTSGETATMNGAAASGSKSVADPIALSSEPVHLVETSFLSAYRKVVHDIAALIDDGRAMSEDEFFHGIRLMQMLGVRVNEVVQQFGYGHENVSQWMKGSRSPHPMIRPVVLKHCYSLLSKNAEMSLPSTFRPARPLSQWISESTAS
jgi:hypothetical protein